MAGYTKADYDALYSIRVSRHFDGRSPGENEVRINYHRWGMAPILAQQWATLQPVLLIQPTDKVCVVGAGFGWGIEALVAESGATVVGVDISDYVMAEKDNTEEAELRAAIAAAGLDPDTGKGAIILAGIYDGQPRSNVVILNEDMQTNQSRNAIKSAIGGWPNVVIFEDLIDNTTTDQEITFANNAANLFAGSQRVIWVHSGFSNKSFQDIQTLTGSEVVSTDGQVHLVP